MKRKLQSIAMQLSEDEIQELMRLKKQGDKKSVALRKKRDRLAAELARLDAQLAKMGGDVPEKEPARRGRKPKAKVKAAPARRRRPSAAKPAAKKGAKPGRSSRRNNLSAAVTEIFSQAGTPLKASQVVDGLPGVGIKVKDVAAMRKRISVVLASQKKRFEPLERGVYQLKSE